MSWKCWLAGTIVSLSTHTSLYLYQTEVRIDLSDETRQESNPLNAKAKASYALDRVVSRESPESPATSNQ